MQQRSDLPKRGGHVVGSLVPLKMGGHVVGHLRGDLAPLVQAKLDALPVDGGSLPR